MFMFHAACPASHQPALRPTRGSGDGTVAETIGVTGFGMTFGGSGGGGGGVPRPARPPPAGAPAPGAAAAAPAAGVAGCSAGAAAGCGAAGAAAGACAAGAGVVAGGLLVVDELPHAAMNIARAPAVIVPVILDICKSSLSFYLLTSEFCLLFEHVLHDIDLDGLIGLDVVGELEHGFVLRRA